MCDNRDSRSSLHEWLRIQHQIHSRTRGGNLPSTQSGNLLTPTLFYTVGESHAQTPCEVHTHCGNERSHKVFYTSVRTVPQQVLQKSYFLHRNCADSKDR